MTPLATIFHIGLHHYLVLSAVLFVSGVVTILLKRNAIGILIGVELVLNAACLNLVAFNRFSHGQQTALDGQIFALFIIVLAAAEAAVALAIFLNFYNNLGTVDVDEATEMKG